MEVAIAVTIKLGSTLVRKRSRRAGVRMSWTNHHSDMHDNHGRLPYPLHSGIPIPERRQRQLVSGKLNPGVGYGSSGRPEYLSTQRKRR